MITTKDIFRKAHELSLKHGLAKGEYAIDDKGNSVGCSDRTAVCFCTYGFIARAKYELQVPSYVEGKYNTTLTDTNSLLDKRLEPFETQKSCGVVAWSDAPNTTIEDVRLLFAELAA